MPIGVTSVTILEGTHTPSALNVEENVILVEPATTTHPFLVEGWISLENMATGDATEIREKVSIVTPLDYKEEANKQYVGAYTSVLVKFRLKGYRYAMKITLKQTAGTIRSYKYQFYQYTLGVV